MRTRAGGQRRGKRREHKGGAAYRERSVEHSCSSSALVWRRVLASSSSALRSACEVRRMLRVRSLLCAPNQHHPADEAKTMLFSLTGATT